MLHIPTKKRNRQLRKKKQKPMGSVYMNIIANEEYLNLGMTIIDFRDIKFNNNLDQLTSDEIDLLYQEKFDEILDGILNCHEMNNSNVVMKSLTNVMNIRRGFKKLPA